MPFYIFISIYFEIIFSHDVPARTIETNQSQITPLIECIVSLVINNRIVPFNENAHFSDTLVIRDLRRVITAMEYGLWNRS